MTDTTISRDALIATIRATASAHTSTLSIVTTNTTVVITNDSKWDTDELVRKLHGKGYSCTKLWGQFNKVWYIHVQLESSYAIN